MLAIGAARYAFLVAGWLLPWMRAQLPPRHWRKVVAATQGIVLAIAAADVLPLAVTQVALLVALALLSESFGRDVWWLWRHRYAWHARVAAAADRETSAAQRAALANADGAPASPRALTVLAALLVWARWSRRTEGRLTPGAFVRLPLEGVAVVALALVLPAARRDASWPGSSVRCSGCWSS